jgi:hypothetical protein
MINPEKLAEILLENGWKDTADAQHTKLRDEIIPAIASELQVFVIYAIENDQFAGDIGFTFDENNARERVARNADLAYKRLEILA